MVCSPLGTSIFITHDVRFSACLTQRCTHPLPTQQARSRFACPWPRQQQHELHHDLGGDRSRKTIYTGGDCKHRNTANQAPVKYPALRFLVQWESLHTKTQQATTEAPVSTRPPSHQSRFLDHKKTAVIEFCVLLHAPYSCTQSPSIFHGHSLGGTLTSACV